MNAELTQRLMNIMDQHVNQIRVMDSQVQALVSLLSKDDQARWFVQHTLQCADKGIDLVTGAPVPKLKPQPIDDMPMGEAVAISYEDDKLAANRMANAAVAMNKAVEFDDEKDC